MRHLIVSDVFPLLLLALFLSNCSSVTQKLNQNSLYRRDLPIVVDGIASRGTFVAPQKASYAIQIGPADTIDMLIVESCHKQWTGERVETSQKGILWWKKENKFTYDHIPTAMEFDKPCPLHISALTVATDKNAWAYVDFEDSGHTLPAEWACNGETKKYNGVSVCQSRAGLMQKITFPSTVLFSPKDEVLEGKSFDIECEPGENDFVFQELSAPNRKHRAHMICNSDIVIRGQ